MRPTSSRTTTNLTESNFLGRNCVCKMTFRLTSVVSQYSIQLRFTLYCSIAQEKTLPREQTGWGDPCSSLWGSPGESSPGAELSGISCLLHFPNGNVPNSCQFVAIQVYYCICNNVRPDSRILFWTESQSNYSRNVTSLLSTIRWWRRWQWRSAAQLGSLWHFNFLQKKMNISFLSEILEFSFFRFTR